MRVRVVGFPVYGIRYSDTGRVCSIPVWLAVYSHAAYSCTVNRYQYCAAYCIPVRGWMEPERVVADCGRELRTHISCDYSVAKGAYESNPDHAGYPQARPRSNAAFQGMWGRLCWLDGSQLVFADVLDTTI